MIEVVVRDDAEANWIAEPGDPTTLLVLLAVAAAGPTAELLRVGAGRDVANAQERLELTARTSTSSNDPTNQQAVTLTPHDTLIHRP
jgi:hypothetical protein